MRRRRRSRGFSRSARSSARPRSSSTWAHSSTRTAASPSACCGPATERGASPANAACCAVCTCPGIDPSTNQPTDIPIDCAAPHAMEVSGVVNLAEKFPAGLPPEPEQDGFIKDECTRMTDAYLAPIQLRSTTLTLIYSTVSLPSWSAGSHQVSCSIGATLGNGGWSTLLNSAKGPLQINGQPPVAPPDIPLDRLNLPPIPAIEPQMPDDSSSSSSSSSQSQYGTGQ